jgi:mRNA interferase RelE/StbE
LSPDSFSIAETDSFQKKIESRNFKHLKNKIQNYVYPILKVNPFFGPNIKKLKGEFEGIYRYRIGNFRLFYTIEEEKLLVISVDIEKRKDAYK